MATQLREKIRRDPSGTTSDKTTSNEECIPQELGKKDGHLTRKFSRGFSRTYTNVLGTLPTLGKPLLCPQIRVKTGSVPGTSRNMNVENQEPAAIKVSETFFSASYLVCITLQQNAPLTSERNNVFEITVTVFSTWKTRSRWT